MGSLKTSLHFFRVRRTKPHTCFTHSHCWLPNTKAFLFFYILHNTA
jgi:hypothetical protein